MRVLLVEDERKVADALLEGLATEGFDVVHEHTGDGGFYRASTDAFDLLLIDLGLPGRDGIDILKTLRHQGVDTRAIVLTARDSVADRVSGLDAGADDYVVKPFAFAELLARIRAVGRRATPAQVRLKLGDLELDLLTRSVQRAGQPVELTVREFDVLAYLMRHPGEVVSRETIARDVWEERERSTPLDNVIDVHIARLRRKVEQPGSRPLIHTIRGVGFILSEEDEL
jgi:DNA-binding response OmpR family regulator